MRRMRAEPVLAVGPPMRAPLTVPALTAPVGGRTIAPAATGAGSDFRRWGRVVVISLIVVLATSCLTSTGASGRALAALIGFPAVLLFWVSVIALPMVAVRSRWRTRRSRNEQGWTAGPPVPTCPPVAPRRVAMRHQRTRVTGAEDNWVKGARGEHAVGAALDSTRLPVLHDRRLRPGSKANIDHLVVANGAVFVVDAKNLGGHFAVASGLLRIDGRSRDELVQGVRRQAGEVARALRRHGVAVPVRPVLCLTGTARPAAMQFIADVVLTTPDTLGKALRQPGLLDSDRRAEIADLLAWAFPPAIAHLPVP